MSEPRGAARPAAGRRQADARDLQFEGTGDAPLQAADMTARAGRMRAPRAIMKNTGRTQEEAALRCGNARPRRDDLLRRNTPKFSLDALVDVAAAAGRRVRVNFEFA